MELNEVITRVLNPAMALLPEQMDTPKARVIMLAIGLQESRFEYRKQIHGPAKGFWQFEPFGGVRGVLVHPASREHAEKVCLARNVPAMTKNVYDALQYDDILAACFARLLLWTDAHPLPHIGMTMPAWNCYIRNWRPGQPHIHTWPKLYDEAVLAWGSTQQTK